MKLIIKVDNDDHGRQRRMARYDDDMGMKVDDCDSTSYKWWPGYTWWRRRTAFNRCGLDDKVDSGIGRRQKSEMLFRGNMNKLGTLRIIISYASMYYKYKIWRLRTSMYILLVNHLSMSCVRTSQMDDPCLRIVYVICICKNLFKKLLNKKLLNKYLNYTLVLSGEYSCNANHCVSARNSILDFKVLKDIQIKVNSMWSILLIDFLIIHESLNKQFVLTFVLLLITLQTCWSSRNRAGIQFFWTPPNCCHSWNKYWYNHKQKYCWDHGERGNTRNIMVTGEILETFSGCLHALLYPHWLQTWL